MVKIQKHVTFNQVKGIFGFTDSDCIGESGSHRDMINPNVSKFQAGELVKGKFVKDYGSLNYVTVKVMFEYDETTA